LVLSRFIWWSGPVIQAIILFRGSQAHILVKYRFFYAYVATVFATTILMYLIWTTRSSAYNKSYWLAQFLTLMIGCGIMLEIFKHVLAPYPGAERFATAVVLITFAIIFLFALIYQAVAPNWSSSRGTAIELERDVRTVQAIFLFVVFAIIFYYRVPMGRNLRGMIAGYALYVGTSLLALAVRAYAGPEFNGSWTVIQPAAFAASLTVWLIALWSFHPNPAPDPAVALESDYEALAAKTRRTLAAMRSHLH
jgi:hypothetical protein